MMIAIGMHQIVMRDTSQDDEGTPQLIGSWVWRLWDGKSSTSDPDSSWIGDEQDAYTETIPKDECEIVMELSKEGDLKFTLDETDLGTFCSINTDEEGLRPVVIFTSLNGKNEVELLGGDHK